MCDWQPANQSGAGVGGIFLCLHQSEQTGSKNTMPRRFLVQCQWWRCCGCAIFIYVVWCLRTCWCEVWSSVFNGPVQGFRPPHDNALMTEDVAHFFYLRNGLFQVVRRKRLAPMRLVEGPVLLVCVSLFGQIKKEQITVMISCCSCAILMNLLSLPRWREARGRSQLAPRSPPPEGPIRCSCRQDIPAAGAQRQLPLQLHVVVQLLHSKSSGRPSASSRRLSGQPEGGGQICMSVKRIFSAKCTVLF